MGDDQRKLQILSGIKDEANNLTSPHNCWWSGWLVDLVSEVVVRMSVNHGQDNNTTSHPSTGNNCDGDRQGPITMAHEVTGGRLMLGISQNGSWKVRVKMKDEGCEAQGG